MRRKARWEIRRADSPIVVYCMLQSTESPMRRNSASKACSSSAVSWRQSSMKFSREIPSGAFGGSAGGVKSGSYGRLGSQRTPK